MFKILRQIKKCSNDIKIEQEKTLKKQKEFEEKWGYLGKRNLSTRKKLP